MTLNSSGPISLGGSTTGESVALELGLSPTGQISLDDAAVRSLLAKTGQSSEISLFDAYGKSSSISFASEYNFNNVFQKVIGTKTFDTYGLFRGINCRISGDGRTFAVAESYIDNNDTNFAPNARTRSTGILSVYYRSSINQWTKQIDQIFIDGTYPSNFGQGLDLSYDGNTLAVGSFTNGTRIYVRSNNQWLIEAHITPAGSTSPQQSGTDNGAACVSLSGDGNTLAIGNPDWFNGVVRKGAIIIYERIGTTWTSKYGWIRGSAYQATSGYAIKFGAQLKLNFAGNLLIVGVDNHTDNFNTPEYYYQSGVTPYGSFRKARIYERNNGTWSLISTIEGNREAGNTMDLGLLVGNASKVSVSADGIVITVSSIIEGYGSNWNPGSGYGSGLVRVYSKVNGNWSLFQVLYDPAIQTTTYSNPPLYGAGLSLNEDGSIIVINSTSKIYVYQSKDGAAYELKQTLSFDTWNNSFVNYSAAVSMTPDAKKLFFGIRDDANTTLPTFLPVGYKLYSSGTSEFLVDFNGLNAPVTLSATNINIAGSKNVGIAFSGSTFVVVCQTGSGSSCTPKFTYSTDEGSSWSPLTTMGSGYNTGRADHAVCIAVNPKNNVFVYANYGLSGGSTFPIVIARSAPGGQTWNTPFEVAVPSGVDSSNYGVINTICFCPLNNRFIAMGVNIAGTPIYTYSDTSGLGTGWSTPSLITSNPSKLRPFSIATNTSGDKMVAIARLSTAGSGAYVYGGQPYSSYSLDGGVTWSFWRIMSAGTQAQFWYKVVYNSISSQFVALCSSNAGVMRFSTIAAADLVGVGADPNLSPWSAWSQLGSNNATVDYFGGAAINSGSRIVALGNSVGSPPNYLPYWSTSTSISSTSWSNPNQFTQSPTLWFDDIVCNSRGKFIAVGFSGSASTIQYCLSN
jgi:hypothetical protein